MFPKDYFTNEVELAFKTEFDAAMNCGFAAPILLDEETTKYKLHWTTDVNGVLVLYRGWMKHLHEYCTLEETVFSPKRRMLVSSIQYANLHYFSDAYELISSEIYTPKIIAYPVDGKRFITPKFLKEFLGDFVILKDDVKSVKNDDFPTKISTDISKDEMDALIEKFITVRGKLFTKTLLFKKFENLKLYDGHTNEWRVFYFLNTPISEEANSNQPDGVPMVPIHAIEKVANLPSPFYTVDFAEMENGEWMVVETGDGQVSGLSPKQNPFVFYSQLRKWSSNNV